RGRRARAPRARRCRKTVTFDTLAYGSCYRSVRALGRELPIDRLARHRVDGPYLDRLAAGRERPLDRLDDPDHLDAERRRRARLAPLPNGAHEIRQLELERLGDIDAR